MHERNSWIGVSLVYGIFPREKRKLRFTLDFHWMEEMRAHRDFLSRTFQNEHYYFYSVSLFFLILSF